MRTDNQLLESYVRDRSEEAFRELVERRVNLVYSAALRETRGCVAEAQEISQAVFIELARKGRKLLDHPALGAWLYTSVRHSAANLRRTENRRQKREKESLTMNDTLNAD